MGSCCTGEAKSNHELVIQGQNDISAGVLGALET